jgi:hypothetical protein
MHRTSWPEDWVICSGPAGTGLEGVWSLTCEAPFLCRWEALGTGSLLNFGCGVKTGAGTLQLGLLDNGPQVTRGTKGHAFGIRAQPVCLSRATVWIPR